MTAYYNEHDPYAAQWLRNLIAAGHIAPGIVDERKVQDIEPWELLNYTQCHFFAGIGVWSHALRRAGWPDDQPIWTGSCPCQPFSAAGKQKGFSDDRHLWPTWQRLIEVCRPSVVIGEQVASALDWLDLVQTDMETADYAFGASDLCAAGFGGAHLRQRLYFVGLADDDDDARLQRGQRCRAIGSGHEGQPVERGRSAGWLGEPDDAGPFEGQQGSSSARHGSSSVTAGSVSRLADASSQSRQQITRSPPSDENPDGREGWERQQPDGDNRHSSNGENCDTHAPMLGRRPADWLYCRDGKWRPVEPGTFPLVDKTPSRMGRLRAYGNALDAETATQFVGAVIESIDWLEVL